MFLFTRRTLSWIGGVLVIVVMGFVAATYWSDTQQIEPLPVEKSETITDNSHRIIGTSVLGRSIEAYTFGTGPVKLLFIGGIHGGYEWNSVVLAYQFIDFFTTNPFVIPDNITIAIVPSLNPDGVYQYVQKEGKITLADIPVIENTTGIGRFNANNVDLNRNFDCRWQADSSWRSKPVSAGSEPFSEPEAKTIRDFVLQYKPRAVVSWHSQANTVYAGECGQGIMLETMDLMNLYAAAAGYNTATTFDSYVVTGDLEGWLSTINIPSITVELQTHQTVEWEKNLAGVSALLQYYSAK